jgi:hypothetical protein
MNGENATATTTPAANSADQDMLRIAQEADAAMENPATETPGKTADAPQNGTPPAAGDSAKTTTDDDPSKTNPEKKDGTPQDGAPKADESAFSKAKKDAERRDRSWKALDQEKAEFRAEKARYDAELAGLRRELAELRKTRTAPSGPARDPNGATADDYEKLAKDYEEQGRDDLAKAARDRAEALRKQGAAPVQADGRTDPKSDPAFQAQWRATAEELRASDPELAKTAGESPLVAAVNTLLTDQQWGRYFTQHPDGLRAAVEVAKLMRSAQGATELQTKITALEDQAKKDKAEIARLNGLLQPRGSLPAPNAPGGAKKPEDMTDAEIMAAAQAADREAGPG